MIASRRRFVIMHPLAAFTLFTVSVSLVSMVPQVLRARRTRVTEGLSTATVLLTLAVFALWATYGIGIADWAQIVNNVVGLGLYLLLADVVAVETGVIKRWHGPAVALAVLIVSAAGAAIAAPVAAAAVGTALGLVTKVPQVHLALRNGPLWGLDPWAVILGLATAVLWLIYGLVVADVAVIVSSVIGSALQLVIVWRRLPVRRTADSLANGRLGDRVSALFSPVATRFPYTGYAD